MISLRATRAMGALRAFGGGARQTLRTARTASMPLASMRANAGSEDTDNAHADNDNTVVDANGITENNVGIASIRGDENKHKETGGQ